MFNINVDALAEKYGTGFLFMLKEPLPFYCWAYGNNFSHAVTVDTVDTLSPDNSTQKEGWIFLIKTCKDYEFVDDRGDVVSEPFILVNPDDFNKSDEPTGSPVQNEPFSVYIIDKVFSFGKSVEFYPDGSIVIQGEYEDDRVRFEKNQYGLLREYVECMSRARLIENNVR